VCQFATHMSNNYNKYVVATLVDFGWLLGVLVHGVATMSVV